MNYEEKYKEALERVKMEMSKDGMKNDVIARHLAETIFPELRESEDERIRKEIIDFLKLPHPQFVGKRDHEKWIAWLEKQESVDEIVSRCKNSWYNEGKIAGMAEGLTNDEKYQQGWHDALEKQGEQEKDILEDAILDGNEDGLIADTIRYKHEKQSKQKLDKVEPKFKVGDWIINPRTGLIKHIKNVLFCDNNGNYEFESSSMSIDSVDNSFHLWTIQDAKDGDVLYINNTVSESIMIYKSFNNGLIKKYASYNKFGFEGEHYLTLNDGYITPATKEQCTELFLKMHEAGYEWDSEKKELKKIEQKPVWSEENKSIIEEVVSYLINYSNIVESKEDADRIEYLIDKIQDICPHQKQEWSEEDKQHIDSLLKRLDALCRNKFERTKFAISEDEDWLKSLRPQKCLIPSEEEIEKAAQEWDSKANFNPFYMTMENGKPTGVKQSITTHKESFKAGIYWILKSLNS